MCLSNTHEKVESLGLRLQTMDEERRAFVRTAQENQRALDELRCPRHHQLEPLRAEQRSDGTLFTLLCDWCEREFRVDHTSYGCQDPSCLGTGQLGVGPGSAWMGRLLSMHTRFASESQAPSCTSQPGDVT